MAGDDMMLVFDNEFEVTGLVSAFHYEFPKDFYYDGEKHDGWEFVYAESGSLLIFAGSKKLILHTGQLICHKPMEFHSLRPYDGTASAVIFCFFCPSDQMKFFENKVFDINRRQQEYLYNISANAEQVLSPKDPIQISRDGFMNKKDHVNRINEQQIKNSIEVFLLSLFGQTEQDKELPFPKRRRKELAESIVNYLQQNIDKQIRIQDIAKRVSYSPTGIKKIFREETGKTILGYFADLKIAEAKRLISTTDMSLSEISEQLGFSTPAYFSTYFKNYAKLSPSEYRKKISE
jgi:AraC-like DNA-binding protein